MNSLVDLEPFLAPGLYPGITVNKAESLLGPTDFVGTDRQGRDDVFGFSREGGVIEIVRQVVSSEGTEGVNWFLRYRPDECIDSISPILLGQLRSLLEPFPETVIVFGQPLDQEGTVEIHFVDKFACSAVWWLKSNELLAAMSVSTTAPATYTGTTYTAGTEWASDAFTERTLSVLRVEASISAAMLREILSWPRTLLD